MSENQAHQQVLGYGKTEVRRDARGSEGGSSRRNSSSRLTRFFWLKHFRRNNEGHGQSRRRAFPETFKRGLGG